MNTKDIERLGCFDAVTAQQAADNYQNERVEIPPRLEPEKYIYIFTDEEKEANYPRIPSDECWALWSFWRVPNLSHEQNPLFSRGCYYRRRR